MREVGIPTQPDIWQTLDEIEWLAKRVVLPRDIKAATEIICGVLDARYSLTHPRRDRT